MTATKPGSATEAVLAQGPGATIEFVVCPTKSSPNPAEYYRRLAVPAALAGTTQLIDHYAELGVTIPDTAEYTWLSSGMLCVAAKEKL